MHKNGPKAERVAAVGFSTLRGLLASMAPKFVCLRGLLPSEQVLLGACVRWQVLIVKFSKRSTEVDGKVGAWS